MICVFRFVFVGLLFLPTLTFASEGFTLAKAEQLALKHNLLLRAARLRLQGDEIQFKGASGIYDPTLRAEISGSRSRNALNDAVVLRSTDRQLAGAVGLQQLFSTGATLTASFQDARNTTNQLRAIDPEYRGGLTLTFRQPLLRNFGALATERAIHRADQLRQIAFDALQISGANLLRDVRQVWYNTLRLQQELTLRDTSIKLAERLVRDNRQKVEQGVLPPVELLSAQVGVKLRKVQRSETLRQLRDSLDQLSLLVQQPVPQKLHSKLPALKKQTISFEQGVAQAQRKRPELQLSKQQVEQAKLEQRLAELDTKPQLDLIASYGHNTLEDRALDSVEQLHDDELNTFSVGLSFSYPLGNRQRKANAATSALVVAQNQSLMHQTQEQIKRQIKAAIRLLETRQEQIATVQDEAGLAEERLRILLERQEVGLATVTEVLDGEEDLTEARTRESQALADYRSARTDYLFATGTLLDDADVTFAVD